MTGIAWLDHAVRGAGPWLQWDTPGTLLDPGTH
jgi:hypothetical protein